jgi:hypothetical protein
MKKILDKIQRDYLPLYTFMKWVYGNTVGLWFLKDFYVKYIGFYNGKRRLRLLSESLGDDAISKKIKSNKPFMLGRFGSSEVRGIFKDEFEVLCYFAGFFPKDKRLLGKFKEVYLGAAKYLDILAIWNYRNHFKNKIRLMRTLPNIENIVPLSSAGDSTHAWIKDLKGKRVLIIHPFKKTIEHQYKRRAKIGVLPKLKSLEVIKAVQTLGNSKDPRFATWFDALDYMKKEISKKDFDIAILGCGAYGLPLAAHVKSLGKQALHVGGGLQLLFGIRGKRWDKDRVQHQYNKYWIPPMKEDFLKDYKTFEGGCYW